MFGIKRWRARRRLLRWLRHPLLASDELSIQQAAAESLTTVLSVMRDRLTTADEKAAYLEEFAAFAEQHMPGLRTKFELYMAVKSKFQKPADREAA